MPSSPDPLFLLELQATGENLNTWGDLANFVFSRLIEGVAQWTQVPITGTSQTLTNDLYVTNQRRSGMLEFTGALIGDTVVSAASLSKAWVVKNSTTGAFSLTLSTSDGSGITIPRTGLTFAVCDGADVVAVVPTDFRGLEIMNIAGGSVGTSAVNLMQLNAAIAAAVTPIGGGAVRISIFDTSPGFISGKVIGPDGLAGTITNPGADERYQPVVGATVTELMAGTNTAKVPTADTFHVAARRQAGRVAYASS